MKHSVQTSSHLRFYCLLGLLLGLTFLRFALRLPVPGFVLLAVVTVMALLGNQDELAALCGCFIPLHEYISPTYVILLLIVVFLLKYRKDIRIDLTILPLVFLVIWELLHCFASGFAPVEFVSDVAPLALIAVFMWGMRRSIDYPFVVRVLSLTTLAVCVVLFGQLWVSAGFDIGAAILGLQRLGTVIDSSSGVLTVGAGGVNPNTLGIICLLACGGLMQLWLSGQSKKTDWVMMAALLVFGTTSSSRTYLVCLAFMLLLVVFSLKGSLKQKIKITIGLVVLVALALLVLYLIFPELMAYFFGRFQGGDLTTGRWGLMQLYHEYIFSSPKTAFFGIGLQEFGARLIYEYAVATHVPHNGVQEILVAWGIIGTAVFALFIACMIYSARRMSGKRSLIHWIPLLVLLLKIQAGQMITSEYTMLCFVYAYLSLSYHFDRPPTGPEQKKKEDTCPCSV